MNAGIYVAMKLDGNSKRCLQQITNQYSIPNMIPFSQLHATIVFFRKFDHIAPNSANRFKGTITGYKIFLTRDGKKGLVVELESKDMLNRHKELMSMYDLTYEFDTFIPHFTLSYDVGDKFDVTKLPIPNCPIVFESEYVEPLDLDWANKLK
jgi:2'-5' RNA ligase